MSRESRMLAGILLVVLSTVMFGGLAIAAILIPAAFFLSVVSPTATEPNALMNLAYIGALFLAAGVLSCGVDLLRAARRMEP